jgi:hypothetical protein
MASFTRGTPRALLARLIDLPDLPEVVRDLPLPAFAALVREVGVEDASELVLLATTEQLVAAFDEDLFGNARPGEREVFDPGRFVVWLEVLLEAGDTLAAARFVELSEDFVVQALTSLVIVLDEDALRNRMSEGDDEAIAADKALEASLSEEIDGYLLLARRADGWDATMALILALDRDHRAFLERVLDHAARLSSRMLEDLDELVTALSESESLAEDVEAEREERRARQGHVEPRAARSFLELAKRPPSAPDMTARDPVTRAYFRDLARSASPAGPAESPKLSELVATRAGAPRGRTLILAMQGLRALDAARFEERLEELLYLTNVLVAGGEQDGERYRPSDAAASVLEAVERGAGLLLDGGRRQKSIDALVEILRDHPADVLFRRAWSAGGPRGKR